MEEETMTEQTGEKGHQRAKNWDWCESFALINMLEKVGKNWELALDRLHNEQHTLTHIADHNKLREHYNRFTRHDSPLKKPYITPPVPITAKERKTLEKEGHHAEVMAREQEHAARHQRIREEREEAAQNVLKIEARERAKVSTDSKPTASELRAKIKAGEAERKAERKEKTNALAVAAEVENNQKQTLLHGVEKMMKALEVVSESAVAVSMAIRKEESSLDHTLLQGLLLQQKEMALALQELRQELADDRRSRKRKREQEKEKRKLSTGLFAKK